MQWMKICEKALHLAQKSKRPHCTAVIVAAGSASRMQGTDKITANLGGKPVICRTVAQFEHCRSIDEIVVVTRKDRLEEMAKLCSHYSKVRMVVPGGENRPESVMAGLAAASEKTTLVAIHDGARPLVTEEIIARTVSKAEKFHAAAPAVAVKDTVKVTKNGTVDHTPDRSTLCAIQTPQVFDRDLLTAALKNAQEKKLPITDDCSAVEQLGMTVMLTEGSEENLKITTPMDLEIARMIYKRRMAE